MGFRKLTKSHPPLTEIIPASSTPFSPSGEPERPQELFLLLLTYKIDL